MERQAYLTQSTGPECQTFGISAILDTWTSGSPSQCYLQCMVRHPDKCQSIVFNNVTQKCTPGLVAFGPINTIQSSIPRQDPDDLIFYARQPVPPCNTSSGDFALYDVCGTSACLHPSKQRASYIEALKNCKQINSTIFVGSTAARFSLFLSVTLNHLKDDTYLGLTDMDEEGKYVWANGELLDGAQSIYVWDPVIFPNLKGQDCTVVSHGFWPGHFEISAASCSGSNHYYVCELISD